MVTEEWLTSRKSASPVRYLVNIAILLLLLLTPVTGGCTSIHPVKILGPAQERDVLATSDVVVRGTITQHMGKANYTLLENLQPKAPWPRHGYYSTMTVTINQVLKGEFAAKELKIVGQDIRTIDEKTFDHGVIRLQGKEIWVGWSTGIFGEMRHIQIVDLAKTPMPEHASTSSQPGP